VLEDVAVVNSDGRIVLPSSDVRGDNRGTNRYNACEVWLYWSVGDAFGVQQVKAGVREPITVRSWRKRLQKQMVSPRHHTYQQTIVAQRIRQIRAVFPGEQVAFRVLGWRPANVQVVKLAGATLIKARVQAKVTPP